MLNISEIKTFEELLSLENQWNPLLNRSETNTIFLTYEWIANWWKIFGKGKELLVLLVKNDENLVGIAPLMIANSKKFGIIDKKIQFIGAPLADYCDFIIAEDKESVLKQIYSYILEKKETWDTMSLDEVPEKSSTIQLSENILQSHTKNFDIFNSIRCLALDFRKSSEEELAKLLKKKDLQRHIKFFRNAGNF